MLLLTKCGHLLLLEAVGCLQTADLYLLQPFSLVQGCHLLFKTCNEDQEALSLSLHMASQWKS